MKNESEMKYFVLTFISLLSLILYVIKFNTNNKHHFLSNGETIILHRKKAKIYSIL